MSVLSVMSLLGEDVQDNVMAYGLKNLKYFPRDVARTITVQPCNQPLITVTSLGDGLSLIGSCHDRVESHQFMIAWGILDIITG